MKLKIHKNGSHVNFAQTHGHSYSKGSVNENNGTLLEAGNKARKIELTKSQIQFKRIKF